MSMHVGILRFPGSNCDDDAMRAIAGVLGEKGTFVWHKETRLPAARPGRGFSS
jgi:phosphoribosylformylglycinamidine (FGAM) synthase-like amidotransferase family enzyme